MFYYRGLREWENERDICATPASPHQDKFKKYLDYFKIKIE